VKDDVFNDLLLSVLERTEEIAREKNEIDPVLLIYGENHEGVFYLNNLPDTVSKRYTYFETIGEFISEKTANIECCFFVTEAWGSASEHDDLPNKVRPSLSSNRKEAIIIEGMTVDKKQNSAVIEIKRGFKNKMVLQKPMINYSGTSEKKLESFSFIGFYNGYLKQCD
jgi:hypothetical protein